MISCPTCGCDDLVHNEYTKCVECGCNLGGDQYIGKHLRAELRELIDEWRGEMIAAPDREIQAQNRTYDRCASDLEELLE